MSRSISAAVEAAVESANVALVLFVELDFQSGFLRVCNAPYTISWNGYDWLGIGHLGGIDPIPESTGLEAAGVALRLSGVPSSGEGASEHIATTLG